MQHPIRTALLSAAILTGASAAFAQEPPEDDSVFFIRTVTCQEVLSGTPENSGYAFVFMYGYAAGEAELDLQTSQEIERIINLAKAECDAEPTATVLDTYRSVIATATGVPA